MGKDNKNVMFRYNDSGLTEGEKLEYNLLKCLEYSVNRGKMPKNTLKRMRQLESKIRKRKDNVTQSEYDEKYYSKSVDAVDSLPF